METKTADAIEAVARWLLDGVAPTWGLVLVALAAAALALAVPVVREEAKRVMWVAIGGLVRRLAKFPFRWPPSRWAPDEVPAGSPAADAEAEQGTSGGVVVTPDADGVVRVPARTAEELEAEHGSGA